MTISSIGTGGTYTTIQAWEDACPANITAAGTNEDWIGELKNQEFLLSSTLTVSGMTTDSTHRVILRCQTGASFRDNASKATNNLTYNSGYGACVKLNVGYLSLANLNSKHVSLLNTMFMSVYNNAIFSGAVNLIIDSCIAVCNSVFDTFNLGASIKNSVFRTGSINIDSGTTNYNNTYIAKTSGSYRYAYPWYGGGSTFTNCLFLGYQDYTASHGYTMNNCGTTGTFANCTATSCITGLTAANEIVAPAFGDSTVANMDAKLKSGASSIGSGTSSGAPSVDIIGQARS